MHADGRRARALDLRAHGGEQRGQVDDLGLARAVLHQRFALGQHRGHQQVFGAGDGDLVEDQMRAVQALGARLKIAVLLRDHRAHLLQALDVQIDGTAADGAAAGHGHARHAGARNQRAQHQRAGAHGLDDFVRATGSESVRQLMVVRSCSSPSPQLDLRAHRGQQPPLGLDVAHLGNVLEGDLVLGENGRGHAGQRRVLGAGDANGADQRIAAANDELIHSLLGC